MKNAIRSGSDTTAIQTHSTAYRIVAGDTTTWDGAAGARRTGATGPPTWHSSLEVDHHHQSPTRGHRSRRRRQEGSPFDHEGRQPKERCRECPPKRSFRAPLPQHRSPPPGICTPILSLATLAGQEKGRHGNTWREETTPTLYEGPRLEDLLHRLPPRTRWSATCRRPADAAPEHQTSRGTQATPSSGGQLAGFPPSLATTAGREREQQQSQHPDPWAAEQTSFIDGESSRVPLLPLRLRPPERRNEKHHRQAGPEPARRIQTPSPGKEPTTGIAPQQPEPTRSKATMYSPSTSAFPSTSPTGYSGGEGIRSAWPPTADSQGEREASGEEGRGEEHDMSTCLVG
jgi:hypothetical protein